MIIREFYRTREDGVNLYRSYSDQNLKIVDEKGAVFDDVIDVETATHTYTETDLPIPVEPGDLTPEQIADMQNALGILRVTE